MAALGHVASVRAVRFGFRVRGTVQGVGLRPAVYRLATELHLAGLVRNETGSVWIEVEGPESAVQAFLTRLPTALPVAAHVDEVENIVQQPRGETTFRIEGSVVSSGVSTDLPPDSSPCADCLRELGDLRDRRYRYPFINCTACGPRFTIVRDMPYDRSRTTMATFAMCEACRHEYENPLAGTSGRWRSVSGTGGGCDGDIDVAAKHDRAGGEGMCLGIPGEVMQIHEKHGMRFGRVRFGGITRDVCLDYQPDAGVGDFVLVHVGFAISKIDRAHADRAWEVLTDIGQTDELGADQPVAEPAEGSA